jgi:hypothetical protein
MIQSGWNKQNEVSKTSEIPKEAEINKYSDCSNFLNYLFGEYAVFLEIYSRTEYEERNIELECEERKVKLDY